MGDKYIHPDGVGGFKITDDPVGFSGGYSGDDVGLEEVVEGVWSLPIALFVVLGLIGYFKLFVLSWPVYWGIVTGSGLLLALINVFRYPNAWGKILAILSGVAFVAVFLVWGH